MGVNTLVLFPRSYNVMSFDLFDTVIARRYREPVFVFSELERELLNTGYNVLGFRDARIEGELQARAQDNFQQEVILDDIYDRVIQLQPDWLSFRDDMIARELELERKSIYPIQTIVDQIAQLRMMGKQIVFASDIYLPRDFILSILQSHKILHTGDIVFVSSDHGKMKSNGQLFDLILEKLGVDANDVCHVGDNFESDVKQAESRGIRAIHFTAANRNRYERQTDQSRRNELLHGAARLTRLQRPSLPHNHAAIWQTTANISAPMMFCFTNFCIQRSLELGLNKLYFLSRDGQILQQIAKKIIDRFYPGKLDVRYLYVSRQALLFPSLTDLAERDLEWIFAPTSFLSARIVLGRINFSVEEFAGKLNEQNLSSGLDGHLSESDVDKLKHLLLSEKDTILARASKFRDELVGYFRQEELLAQDRVGLVDIGWGGSLQYSMSKILRDLGSCEQTHGFYFGVKRRKLFDDTDRMWSWFTDCNTPRKLDQEAYIVPMTELFTAATHGGVDRYEFSDGAYRPVLRSEQNEPGKTWGVDVQQKAMMCFAEILLDALDTQDDLPIISQEYLDECEEIYRTFLLNPSIDEAKAYCRYEDAEDQTEAYYKRLGKPYTFSELKEYFRSDYMHHHNEWRQGSLRISDQSLARLAYRLVKT